ncbi:MFS transporter [Mycobacterium sp. MYCO198283]|uniref:MFS transporter n=1 Tax=Mycobacterium sp. MYCO198283 TaxID=2883505 RepID=UPI001E3BBCF7|nr:MFS transporter [Mycobacterium sp. MYCO198283]MCG5433363.1 MFS transporter [Mycobacterium sp. MYCO198283]
MSVVVLTVAVLQTAVVPILGIIARQLDASTVAVSWTVTGNLLAAAAATPLLSRLADLHSKRRVLLGVLAVVLVGSLLGALTASLPLLIAARVLQGVSFALYPICVAILREELPADRLVSAMAVLSGTLGFGGGAGLVVTGLVMNGDAGYHRVFWLATGFSVAVLAVVALAVPERPRSGGGPIDWLGAAGLAAGLSAVLLAITQGGSWGWDSPRSLGCAAVGVGVLVGWWRWERRAPRPLVSTAMLSRRAMLMTNVATVFVGMGLYLAFLGLTLFVQTPRAAGYGFGATVLYASVVFLLPGAFAGFVLALVSGRFIDRFGARPVLATGALLGVVGFALLAVLHDEPWQVVVAGIFANGYVSLAYGALPALVVAEARPSETGVATGMNAIARTVGSSTAAAFVAVLLGSAGAAVPPERSYVAIFGCGAATAALAMALILASGVSARPGSPATAVDRRAMNHEWG